MNSETKHRIAFWTGMAGGGVFMLLNVQTQGAVPGGAVGGALGAMIGYPLALAVLALVPTKSE